MILCTTFILIALRGIGFHEISFSLKNYNNQIITEYFLSLQQLIHPIQVQEFNT